MKREQVRSSIEDILHSSPGGRLPAERELAARLGVSRTLLRTILADLELAGRIERRQGSGTYVVNPHANLNGRIQILVDSRLKLGDDPFFSALLDRLQMSLQESQGGWQVERLAPGDCPILHRATSVITLGLAGETLISQLRQDSPPIVSFFLNIPPPPSAPISLFQLENEQAGCEAARRLWERGCRHLLLIGRTSVPDSRARLDGAESFAREAGGSVERLECGMNFSEGLKLGRTLRPSSAGRIRVGIVAANDWMAVGMRAGLSGRSEISLRNLPIASFDGLSIVADPALAIMSLAVPLDSIVRDALDELSRLSASPRATGRVLRYPLG